MISQLMTTGPWGALSAWEGRTHDLMDAIFEDGDDDYRLFSGYFAVPFHNIWAARKITVPSEDEPPSKWILDKVNGANDTCTSQASSNAP